MKKFVLFLILCVSTTFSFGKVLIVDSNLSNGDGTTYFTSIIEAINFASDDDSILIKPGDYIYEEILIDKSLKITPFNKEDDIIIRSNIKISVPQSGLVEILGLNNEGFSITSICESCESFGVVNLVKIKTSHIGSNIGDLVLVNVFNSVILGDVWYSGGDLIKNQISGEVILKENRSYQPSEIEKTLIIGNVIDGVDFQRAGHQIYGKMSITIKQDERELLIANNTCQGGINLKRWNAQEDVHNLIHNNYFRSAFLMSGQEVPRYNFTITSNLWDDFIIRRSCSACFSPGDASFVGDYSYTGDGYDVETGTKLYFHENDWSGTYSQYPYPGAPGYFIFTYNGVNFTDPGKYNPQTSPLSFTSIVGNENSIDGGNPSNYYYDSDLTINDRGPTGGPYGGSNLEIEGLDDTRSFIYFIDLPIDIFPGQSIPVKVKGYTNGN